MSLSVHLHEWERLVPDRGRGEALQGRRLSGPDARALAAQLERGGQMVVRELVAGLSIEATSFVGKVTLGDLIITVSPKLRSEALVRLFRYAYRLRDLALVGQADFARGGAIFQDLLLTQLHAEVRELLSRGLVRRYVAVVEELPSPRGRIDMNRLAARPMAQRSTLPCRHTLRLEDSDENRLLLGGLRLGQTLATDRALAASLHALADELALGVRPMPLTGAALNRGQQRLDRHSAAYAPALGLVELLFEGHNLALDDEEEPCTVPGFLFDMNRFFQRLVGRFLQENLEGHKVREEHALEALMRYAPGENPRGRRSPRPRPDFEVLNDRGQQVLLDAKYRDLWERPLPREMLYQLALYALSQPSGGWATILYPCTSRGARRSRIELRDPVQGWGRASVVLQPVDLEELARSVEAGAAPAGQRAREAVARRWLAP